MSVPVPDRDRLLDAVLAVAGETSLAQALRRLVGLACDLTGARYGALGVIGPDGALSDFIHVGLDQDTVHAIGDPPKGNGILGVLIVDPRPLRLDNLGANPDSFGFPPHHPPMRSFLGVPIRVGGDVWGNLYLTEKVGGGAFTLADEREAMVLATAAAAVIENSRRQALARDLAVMEDRERIARDLHDTVIQRLYAAGMGLQALCRRVAGDEAVTARLGEVIDTLDDTIREIRSVIFAVSSATRTGHGLRADTLQVAVDATSALGFEPTVAFVGPVDALVPEGIADHALAVVREALTNVARHASATRAEVTLTVDERRVQVEVRDDGRGPQGRRPAKGGGGMGLVNLTTRAHALGGDLTVLPRDGGGTVLRWQVPLDS